MFSIIVPTYNDDKYIERCVDSILNQTYRDFEVIVVIDGSTDKTVDILNKKYSYNNQVTIIYQNNAGAGAARNNGIQKSKGDYIVFVDSDDWLEEDALMFFQEQIKSNNSDWIISSSRIVEYYKNGIRTLDLKNENGHFISEKEVNTKLVDLYSKGRTFGPVANVYKRSIIEQNSIFFPNERRSQDILFNNVYMRFVKTLSVYDKITYNVRVLPKSSIKKDKSSRRNDRSTIESELNRLRTIERIIETFNDTLLIWKYELTNDELIKINTRYFIEIHNALFSVWERNPKMVNSMVLSIHNYSELISIIYRKINCFFYYKIVRFCLKHRLVIMLKTLFCFKKCFYFIYLIAKRKKQTN